MSEQGRFERRASRADLDRVVGVLDDLAGLGYDDDEQSEALYNSVVNVRAFLEREIMRRDRRSTRPVDDNPKENADAV